MHRKVWFLVAAAVAVLALTGTAAAATSSSAPRVLRAKAFSQGRLAHARSARAAHSEMNFGMEQNVYGFNSLDAQHEPVLGRDRGRDAGHSR